MFDHMTFMYVRDILALVALGSITFFVMIIAARHSVIGRDVAACLTLLTTFRQDVRDLKSKERRDAYKTRNWSSQSSGTSSDEDSPPDQVSSDSQTDQVYQKHPKSWTEQSSGSSNETSGSSGSTQSNPEEEERL